nr:hypothetical protein OG781_41840 [Streptomyces sp. NBC_00830]
MTDPTGPEPTGTTSPDAPDSGPEPTGTTSPDAPDSGPTTAEDKSAPKPPFFQRTWVQVTAVLGSTAATVVVFVLSASWGSDKGLFPSKPDSASDAEPLPSWVWPLTSGVIGLLVAGAYWAHWLVWKERLEESRRDRDALESAAHRLREKMELSSLVEFNRVRLDQYHGIATNQASKAFRSSRIAMNIGLLILVVAFVAGWRLNAQGDRLFVGIVAAVGTAFAGYLSRTYMATYERTLQQLNQYFNQPVMNGYFLTAERIAASLTGDRKEVVLERVVDGVLESGKVLHHNVTGVSKQDQAKPRKRWWQRRAAQGEATAPTE